MNRKQRELIAQVGALTEAFINDPNEKGEAVADITLKGIIAVQLIEMNGHLSLIAERVT